MAEGELSTRMMIFPSKIEAAAVSGRSEKFKFREWIEPFIGKETLCQAFLIHGQRIYLQILNPFLDFIQELLINPVFHITDGNVSVGALSGRCYFHGKPGIADSPPNQGRIKNQGFHKAISGAPHDFILFRFADTAGKDRCGSQS